MLCSTSLETGKDNWTPNNQTSYKVRSLKCNSSKYAANNPGQTGNSCKKLSMKSCN